MTTMSARSSTFENIPVYTRHHVLKYWGWYVGGGIALAGTTYVTIQIPQIAKSIVNLIAGTNTSADSIGKARHLALVVVGLGFLQMIIRAMSRILIFWPGRKLETQSKDIIFASAMRVPDAGLRKFGMGDLVSRIANDVGHLRAFFAFGALQLANLVFLSIFVIAKMFQVHQGLAIFCLIPLSGTFLVFRVVMPKLHKFSLENQAALGRLTNRVTEAFVNFHVIAANGAQSAFVTRTDDENKNVYRTNIQVLLLRMVAFPLMTCLSGLSQLVVLFYGGMQVLQGKLSVGDILAFNVYIGLLAFPLTALGFIAAIYQRAQTALKRLTEIEMAPKEGEHGLLIQNKVRTSATSLLEIKGLSFHHENSKNSPLHPFKLHEVNLSLAAGQKIGVFGPIGSGKSTLFNLIARVIEPQPNTICFDGQDILASSPQELRTHVAYGLQSVHLFSDSIRSNVCFGLEIMPTQKELDEACRQAMILGEILAFEKGWETQIGEKGLRLSGGQKQRLALARIFLRRPKLMLLDDVLSAVDQSTETALLSAIFAQNCALLMVSHRPSALKRCDEIIVMREGAIVDHGKFDQLAQRIPELQEELNKEVPR